MPNTTHESLAAEAIAYLRESAGAVGGFNGVQQEIRRQADFLVKWAQERGVFLTDFDCIGLEKYNRETTEHSVYFGEADGRDIKCINRANMAGSMGQTENLGRIARQRLCFIWRGLN